MDIKYIWHTRFFQNNSFFTLFFFLRENEHFALLKEFFNICRNCFKKSNIRTLLKILKSSQEIFPPSYRINSIYCFTKSFVYNRSLTYGIYWLSISKVFLELANRKYRKVRKTKYNYKIMLKYNILNNSDIYLFFVLHTFQNYINSFIFIAGIHSKVTYMI